MKSNFVKCIVILFALSFFACNEVGIVHDLNERDANEILVLLSQNDIEAKKEKEVRNQEIFWSVTVSPGDSDQARSILVANHLPKIRHGGLEGICKDAGLILTPKTEKCREILAFKGEIINSLESIPGVVSADVVLNIPDKDEFPDENSLPHRPTASVTIRYLSDANVQTKLTEGKIQEFVANGIAGLDSRDVSVIISYLQQRMHSSDFVNVDGDLEHQTDISQPDQQKTDLTLETAKTQTDESTLTSVGGLSMDQDSAKKFKVISSLFLVLLLLLSAAFIYALIKISRMRKQSPVEAEEEGGKNEDNEQKLLGA